jgi:hypothetical protein
MNIREKYKSQIDWLLEGDPSIRYQTLRDLVDSDEKDIESERKKILKKGWGKRYIDFQEKNGTWSNALYSPKWTSTFYTLLLLKRFGALNDEKTEKACNILLDKGFYENDGGINYWKSWKQGECCVTGMLLSMLCHFQIKDDRIHQMVEYLIKEQMPDKGWNCERNRGATHSSFHTTISALEGLWEYEKEYRKSALTKSIQKKQEEGIEFLLKHHLYKSNTTWKTIDPKMIRLSFPPRWHYDILRGLDYFQERNIKSDQRMNDAVDLLLKKQTPAGYWKLENEYPAKIFFKMENRGKESRWNTLRSLRILKWWDN